MSQISKAGAETVLRADDGSYYATDGASVLATNFASSSEAWRWLDRRSGDAVSAAEKRAQYGFEQSAIKSFLPDREEDQ